MSLFADVRYGLRMLARNFRLSALAGVILGLAIGGSAAIFNLVDVVFLRPLAGVSAPRQLVHFERVQPGLSATDFSYPDYLVFRDSNRAFAAVAAHCAAPLTLTGSATERIRGDLVTGNYFSVLGVRPALGRLLVAGDDGVPGADPVAVLSYPLWRRSFGSDPAIVGKSVTLNGHAFVVVGVAASNFAGTDVGQPDDLWVPLSMQAWGVPGLSADILSDRAAGWIDIFGRLKEGVPLVEAQAVIGTIADRLAKDYPVTNGHRRVRLLAGLGMDPDDQQDVGRLLGLLLAAVAILLLTAAANVGTLLLACALGRQREMAIRLAIGSGPEQIVRQLLVEALLLASVAGIIGVLLTPWVSSLLAVFRHSSPVLRGIDTSVDWRLAAFVVVLIIATGILLGLAPALESSTIDLASSLKQTSRTATSQRPVKQQLLVIFQLSLSFLLLTGTGLMLKTMHRLESIAPGFDSHNVLLMSMSPGIQGYSESRGIQLYGRVIDGVRTLAGVRSASIAQTVPPQELGSRVSVFPPGQVPPLEAVRGREFETGLRVDANFIMPHYFSTLAIPMRAGRDFNEHDNGSAPGVAIVNEALAERMWPRQNAVGKQIVWPSFEGPPRPPMTIVGVAGNTRQRSLALDPPMVLYVPIAQSYVPAITLLVRTENNPIALTRQIQQQIASVDQSLALFRIQTMEEHVSDSQWRQRATLGMIGSFGALSMIIAAVGLYGMISQWVLQRTHDIGIRIALGASRRDVLKLVLRHCLTLAMAGIVAGLFCAFVAGYLGGAAFASFSYGVRLGDPAVITAVTVLLLSVALGSSVVPALRALRADPASALRAE